MARVVDIIFRAQTAQARADMAALGTEASRLGSATDRAFARSQSRLRAVGGAAVATGRTMTGIGLALGAVGYVAGKSAMNFQTAMERIHTQAGASQSKVNELSAAVLKLGASGQVQYGPAQLAQALYHIESVASGTYPALRNTSTAMMALKTATMGAAIGGSDLEDTTSALTGAMFAMHAKASQLPQIMGMINATVGTGNMKMADLVQALGRGVIPAFQSVGLTAKDAFAALALFADSGYKASSAAAQVGTALHFLGQPSAKADKFLAAIGMSSTQMAADLNKPQGLLVALQDLKNNLSGYSKIDQQQALYALFPGGRGRILLTAIQNLDKLGGKYKAQLKLNGDLNESYKKQSGTLSGQLHIAWAQINTELTKFGTTLIPIIEHDLPIFLHALEGTLKFFTGLPGPVKSFIAELAIGFAIGGPILIGVGKLIGLFTKLRGAMYAIRAAGIAAGVGEAAASGGAVAGGAVGTAATAARLAPWMVPGGPAYAPKEVVNVSKLARVGQGLGTVFRALPLIGTAFAILDALDQGPPSAYGLARASAAKRTERALVGHGAYGGLVVPSGIRRYQFGGQVANGPDTVPAMLSVGEGVLNRTAMSGLGVGGLNALNGGGDTGGILNDFTIQPAPVYVMLDGRVLAKGVLQQTLRKAARGPSSLVGGALVTGSQ